MFFFKWPPVAILDVKKSLLTISDQYHNFNFVNFCTTWLPASILDIQNSLSMAFLAISDQYNPYLKKTYLQNGRRRPFWMAEFSFEIFDKMAAVGHFGCPRLTFDNISGHFRSIETFLFYFTKWLPAAILDVRKSLSITFLAISDQYQIL